jgi:hypothetical protein
MRRMRGDDRQPNSMFSYVSAEQRVPKDHPLRAIRAVVDDVLRGMSREFDGLYATVGRPSIPPERLLRAQLLQISGAASRGESGHPTPAGRGLTLSAPLIRTDVSATRGCHGTANPPQASRLCAPRAWQ